MGVVRAPFAIRVEPDRRPRRRQALGVAEDDQPHRPDHGRSPAPVKVSDLTALPRGRAVLLASGLPAALLRLDHHSARPYADKVRASQAHYENQRAARTSVPARAREAA